VSVPMEHLGPIGSTYRGKNDHVTDAVLGLQCISCQLLR